MRVVFPAQPCLAEGRRGGGLAWRQACGDSAALHERSHSISSPGILGWLRIITISLALQVYKQYQFLRLTYVNMGSILQSLNRRQVITKDELSLSLVSSICSGIASLLQPYWDSNSFQQLGRLLGNPYDKVRSIFGSRSGPPSLWKPMAQTTRSPEPGPPPEARSPSRGPKNIVFTIHPITNQNRFCGRLLI